MWSFKEQDPPNGADGQFILHDFKGSMSLNLLGGLVNPPSDPPGTESFAIEVENVRKLYTHVCPYMAHAWYLQNNCIAPCLC